MKKTTLGRAARWRKRTFTRRHRSWHRSWVMALLLIATLSACSEPAASLVYALRVQDHSSGQPIVNAKVTLDVPGKAPLDEFTDSNGYTRIPVDAIYVGRPGRLQVEASGYQSYIQNIDVTDGTLPHLVQLEPSGQAAVGAPSTAPAATAAVPPAAASATTLPPIDWGGFDRLFTISDLKIEQHVPMPSAGGSVMLIDNALTFIVEARENVQSYSLLCTFSFFDKDNIQVDLPSTVSFDPAPFSWERGTRSRALIILPVDVSQVMQIRGSC
jgi:hypothetical protein